LITDTAEALLAQALEGWRATGLPDPTAHRVVVGAVAVDDCCTGFLIVSIDQLLWFDPFPVEALRRTSATGQAVNLAPTEPCSGTLGADVTIHVGMCIPSMDSTGRPPDPAEESAAMKAVVDVAETIEEFIVCANEDCWTIGATTFIGPDGGCLIAQISARIDSCPAVAPV
jgi:hypothetical protein